MLYIARYTPRDRKTDAGREHRLGRQLLRYGLEQEYGRTWEAVCGPHGRPVLAEGPEGLQFSITHTRGLAACLIGERNLGLDAEQIRPADMRTARKVCTDGELEYVLSGTGPFAGPGSENRTWEERFFEIWTLKESYCKAIGLGLAFPMREIAFTKDKEGTIAGSRPGWRFWQTRLEPGGYVLAVCAEQKEGEEQEEGRGMTYEEIFQTVKERLKDADVSGIGEHLAFQFNITGEGEGAFYAEVKDGRLIIEPYEYYDRDAVFACSADTMLKILSGKMDPVFAFTLGKLKVEGSLEKALKVCELVKRQEKKR